MIRCLAIDDEKLALDLLEDNIRKIPFLELAGKCNSGFTAMEILQKEKIDLIFLDIQMPDISGIQFLKSLPVKPMVIFTTAFENYALEGFELDVIDYLLKPFSFERFLKAVNKAQEYHSLLEKADVPASGGFLFVKSEHKLVRLQFDEILYVESLKDYVKIYTGEKPIVTLLSMKVIEEKLPPRDFLRVHRSFIVNVRKIQVIEKRHIRIMSHEIPIGDNYREIVFAFINQNKLNE
jgi:DNA-binding LytR/AlgR family response regulator